MRRLLVLALGLLAAPMPLQARAEFPTVVAVRPSGDFVPENLLRISLVFERATGERVIPHLDLRRSDGTRIDGPFLDQELWSSDGKILTVLLHPGRVKTGLIAHDELGRALTVGDTVDLFAYGRAVKRWRVGTPESRQIAPGSWTVVPPRAGARTTLMVDLKRPLDAMDESVPVVAAADGRIVTGRSALLRGETFWTFTPDRPWRDGRYRVLVPSTLEDPSGNTVSASFEHRTATEDAFGAKPLSVPFVVKRPSEGKL